MLTTESQILSEITTHLKYAKFVPELHRRETWHELVTRNKEMHIQKYPHLADDIEAAYQFVYELLAAEQVSVEILDMSGRSIKKWPTEKRSPGSYEVLWQPGDAGQAVPSGTYICRIQTSKGTVSKMMIME